MRQELGSAAGYRVAGRPRLARAQARWPAALGLALGLALALLSPHGLTRAQEVAPPEASEEVGSRRPDEAGAGPADLAPAVVLRHRRYLPLVQKSRPPRPTAVLPPTPVPPSPVPPTPPPGPDPCAPIPGTRYGDLSVNGRATDRPAAAHPDLNLAIRGWQPGGAGQSLVDYGGHTDSRAPDLRGLLPGRLGGEVAFSSVHQVFDWLWSENRRGGPIADWPVTLAGLATTRGQPVHVPGSGYDIGEGKRVLVLYATTERVTLKYTRDDNVVYGYTLHLENVCVEPALRALYERHDRSGRGRLPALAAGEPIGRATGAELLLAVRDTGRFMDPRSRKDWW
jgi:hypothetical protein